jgi:hypothetical protein
MDEEEACLLPRWRGLQMFDEMDASIGPFNLGRQSTASKCRRWQSAENVVY